MRAALIVLLSLLAPLAQAQTPHLRDGRQYLFELARRLDIGVEMIFDVYQSNRANLPAEKNFSLLASSIQPMAKIAAAACGVATDLAPLDLSEAEFDALYRQLLFRPATAAEKAGALRDEAGHVSFFSNCVEIAISPELLFLTDDSVAPAQPLPALEVPVYGRY